MYKIECADNLNFMKNLLGEGLANSFKLIYIDPPFFTKRDFESYNDRWNNVETYIEFLRPRISAMKELLADDGTIWLHLDWHAVHYAKVMMDQIFGMDNFVNEIIWTYKSGGATKKHFARKHDNILVYSKTPGYYISIPKEKSYNRGFKPYRFKNVEEFEDELGWYTLVNMKDVWAIDMVGRTSAERNGYSTQKPETLLKRIIEATTKEGDNVGDFFMGSGTTGKVAVNLKRDFYGCDISEDAVKLARKRMEEAL